MICGDKIVIDGKEYFSLGTSWQGSIYKNDEAFKEPEKYPDEVVYIPEYAVEGGYGIEFHGRDYYPRDEISCYTYNDFLELFKEYPVEKAKKLAEQLFHEVDWQYPETRLYEWEDEDFDI